MIESKLAKNATHAGGKGEILHDWYPYLEGFSSEFVYFILDKYFNKPSILLEPYAGVGTTPISLWRANIECDYCEVNPFLKELIDYKRDFLSDKKITLKILNEFKLKISKINTYKEDVSLKDAYFNMFNKSMYFDDSNFSKLLRLHSLCGEFDPYFCRFFKLIVSSVILKSSLLKRSGDIRFKTKKELNKGIPNVIDLINDKIALIISDLNQIKNGPSITKKGKLITSNAKDLKKIKLLAKYDGVITSPPYLNGTNYIRNTKLELWFMGFIGDKGLSLRTYRDLVVTSAINDVSKTINSTIPPSAIKCVNQIKESSYDLRIHKMVGEYFSQMKLCFEGFQLLCKKNAPICIDIGDSLYNNIHVPTDEILIDIMKELGINLEENLYLRKRYSNNGTELSQRLLVFRNSK